MRRVLRPGRFFVAADASLRVETQAATAELWEIYGSQLLGPGQTREQATFDTWAFHVDPPDASSEQPLVEIKWEAATQRIHVTRSLHVYAWEAFESQPNVIESRLAKTWSRELVASIDLQNVPAADTLEAELSIYVAQAIHGTSRLAITSLENPLPDFALGRIACLSHSSGSAQQPICDPSQLITAASLDARSLEVALRATDRADVAKLADLLATRIEQTSTPTPSMRKLCVDLFNQVALSPFTVLVDNLVDLLVACAERRPFGVETIVDMISYMLRHLVRHLTAFDLKTFHNQGANYPDALFLDRLLQAYVGLISAHAELFEGPGNRLRRRALRQAFWMRQSLESARFPDAPTSPGENQRVLPDMFPRVPERQITQPDTRTRQLFDVGSTEQLVAPGASQALVASLRDLVHPRELRELGMAFFLDRPLGIFKPPGHPDRTPLVSYEAFSHRIAAQRLDDLCQLQIAKELDCQSLLDELPSHATCKGVPVSDVGGEPRAGVVSLADASQVSDDFVFLRTTRRSLDDLLAVIGSAALAHSDRELRHWLTNESHVLLIRTNSHLLAGFDRHMQKRCAIKANAPIEYTLRHGIEHLRNGLSVKPST